MASRSTYLDLALEPIGRAASVGRMLTSQDLRPLGIVAAAALLIALLLAASAPAASAQAQAASTQGAHPALAHAAAKKRARPRLRLPQATLTLGATNRVRVQLRCRKRPCKGTLLVRSTKVRKGKRLRFGSARFKVRRTQGSVRVRVRVSKRIAKKVRRQGRAKVLLIAKVRGQRRSTRRTVTLVLPRPGGPPVPPPPQPPGPTGPNRIKADASRLFDSVTGARFVPRGANFVRLRSTPSGEVYHSTFEPGLYDGNAARAALDGMRAAGYNTVRVFIDPGTVKAAEAHGIGRGPGTSDVLYAPYMDNVANFVALAADRGIYVLPSMDQFPQNDRYWGIVAATIGSGGTPNMAGRNLTYLDKGHVAAKAEYMRQFAAGLIARIGVKSSAILAYQADNELFFEANQAPYDKMSGTVTPLNGVTYDMSNPGQRQQSADASMVEYSRRIKAALLQVDPQALMTIGYFTNRAVGKTGYNGFATYCSTSCTPGVDYRVPGRPAAMSIYGVADFLDIHAYPDASPWNASGELDTVERNRFRKPWIIGELGARKSVYGNDIVKAAYGMRDAQTATCGLGAQGWLFWTQNTHENLANQPLFFHLDEFNGAINGQLAPIRRGDPCKP
jgi:hypothetical protein